MRAIWTSSLVLSIALVASFRWLDTPAFAGSFTLGSVVHLAIVVRGRLESWRAFFASQLMVAVAALSAIGLYVTQAASPTDRAFETFWAFAVASATTPKTYLYFCLYLALFGSILVVLAALLRLLGIAKSWDRSLAARYAYAASAVNLACDYAWRRPLHVQGDPGAADFFFTVGLFGLEFSLPLYTLAALLMLVTASTQSQPRPLGPR